MIHFCGKFISFSCLLTFLFGSSVNAQSVIYFKKNYGDLYPMIENGNFVEVLSDGYLTGGDSFLNTGIESDYHFLKTDKAGFIIHQLVGIDPLTNCYFNDAISIDSNWVFAGCSNQINSNKNKTYIVKTDSSGSIIWQTYIGDTLTSIDPNRINITLDGGFIIGGYHVNSQSIASGCLVKLDSLGNEQWIRYYPSTIANNIIRYVSQNPDSTYTFIGGAGLWVLNGDIWLVNTDKDGFETSSYYYEFVTVSSSDYNDGNHFTRTSDGGILISGITGFFGTSRRGIVFKINSSYQIEWEKILSENSDGSGNIWSSYINKSIILDDNSIVSMGGITSNASGSPKWTVLLLKLDSVGNELWRRTFRYSQPYDSYGYDFEKTDDGGFIISGRAEGPLIGADVYLIKTNCLGFVAKPEGDFSVAWNGSEATFYNLSERADTCIYYFGDGDSAIVQLTDSVNITHQYSGPGPWQAYILAFACGEIDTLFQTITTGINNYSEFLENNFSVYPNPASDLVTISYLLPEEFKSTSLLIADLTGRIIIDKRIDSSSKELLLDVSNLSSGSYHIILKPQFTEGIVRKLILVK